MGIAFGTGKGRSIPVAGGIPRESRRAQSRAGFTLLEILISFSLLSVVLLAFSQVVVSGGLASQTSHDATIARQAARAMIEVLRTEDFSEVFALYNDDPEDDPGGKGTAPGRGFAVDGLDPIDGDDDGLVGTIEFPTLDQAPGVLREDLELPFLGLPVDLNGDGVVDGGDHADDYLILPVVARVQWDGPTGPSICEFRTILGNL